MIIASLEHVNGLLDMNFSGAGMMIMVLVSCGSQQIQDVGSQSCQNTSSMKPFQASERGQSAISFSEMIFRIRRGL